MKYLNKRIESLNKSDYKLIKSELESGHVLVLPTDTIYGLSCLANNKEAISKIYKIKGRKKLKPFITLVSSIAMAKRYAHINKKQFSILKKIWQEKRPTTIILKAKKNNRLETVSQEGKISFRLPKSDFLIKMIRREQVPLVSTSLNKSGQAPIINVKNLDKVFTSKLSPDFVLNTGPSKNTKPSRIIDLSSGDIENIR